MRPLPSAVRRVVIGSFACLLVGGAIAGYLAWRRRPNRGLPYHDAFASGKADEWKAFGGTWELINGTMRNDSDERGAKLLSGSPYWRNYSVEADVYLLGISGDAGLVIRSGREEEGVNAYSGYYAGVRTLDDALVLGRAEHGWSEIVKPNPMPGGILPFEWYHLKLVAVDCDIAASVSAIGEPDQTAIGITDHQCISAGRIGLRSYSSGGIWRNVVVRAATHQDLMDLLQKRSGHGSPVASRATPSDPDSPEIRQLLEREQEQETRAEQGVAGVTTQSIGSLLLSSYAKPASATVRGVVVLTAPRLYVQDTSGGVYVSQYAGPLLKVGDEVEITGQVHPGDFSAVMDHAMAQVLWARSPMPPLSVTASQASTGRFDATFIELRGVLAAKERGPNNSLVLDLDDGAQSFRAMLNPGRSDALVSALRVNSLLRLRGICVVDPALTRNLTPFVLLLPSNEDLDIIAGPPWWNTGHVIALIAAIAALAMISVILYHRIENWRLRAILEERGRLAHEMHDTLAQSFAGIGFQLQAISNGVPQNMPKLHEQLDLARDLVRHSHEEARRSIATLRAEALESEDLANALEHCARRMVAGTAVEVIAETTGDPRSIPLRTMDTLFRIGQEAVANAIRHANPSRLIIHVIWSENHVALCIEDDGRGFEPSGRLTGFGIHGMRRRAQTISGVLNVDSHLRTGTNVRVEAPLPPRVTLALWPRIIWKYAREQWNHARAARTASSHLYRG
jgi:signal transduction histidine kinase